MNARGWLAERNGGIGRNHDAEERTIDVDGVRSREAHDEVLGASVAHDRPVEFDGLATL